MTGGLGPDSIDGGSGDDTLFGYDGADTIKGAGGEDTLFGDAGNDLLLGGSREDFLSGDDGSDRLEGGGPNDYYLSGSDSGAADTVVCRSQTKDVVFADIADILTGCPTPTIVP